ncbi:Phage portal protein [Pseudomonas sp. IT-P74]|uniref:hypothetical protein n=1 Tax=Pseudomonas sp. IT-P74 TaxID=3026445 RepID=UPI0039DF93AC
MKKPNVYTLRIVGSHPSKLTLERMATYLAELAKLMGEKEKVHFDKLSTGSAALRAWAEQDVADSVSKRLSLATNRSDKAAKEAVSALDRINELLAQDGTRGELKNPSGAVIYPFPGGKKTALAKELLVDQDSTITGQVIKIGGRDDTIPVLVKDADGREYNCTIVGAHLAKEISAYYLGDPIELNGKGKWKRTVAGSWELVQLNVKSWSPLSGDWDESYASMEALGLSWSNVPDLEDYLSGLRKGH